MSTPPSPTSPHLSSPSKDRDDDTASVRSACSAKSGVSVRSTASQRARREKRELDQALLNSAYFGNTNAVKKYLKQGADPAFSEERDGWSAIHYAGRWGDCEMLLALLAFGADVNLRTSGKETALHKATRWDQKDVAILLMKKGALPYFKNGDGKTAADMTPDLDLKHLVDNFEQWCQDEVVRIQKEGELKAKEDDFQRQEDEERRKERQEAQAQRERRLAFRLKHMYGASKQGTGNASPRK